MLLSIKLKCKGKQTFSEKKTKSKLKWLMTNTRCFNSNLFHVNLFRLWLRVATEWFSWKKKAPPKHTSRLASQKCLIIFSPQIEDRIDERAATKKFHYVTNWWEEWRKCLRQSRCLLQILRLFELKNWERGGISSFHRLNGVVSCLSLFCTKEKKWKFFR